MDIFLTGSAEFRGAVMRSAGVWEHLHRHRIRPTDVVGQLEFWKEDPAKPGDVIVGPMVYSYAAKVDFVVYVKPSSPRGSWREGRDLADFLFVEGLYRVHPRELVTADSVDSEERLVMTQHDLKQVYVEMGLMDPTEQIFKEKVNRSMVEGKHLLGICPPDISHWAKSFTEVEISIPVSVTKAHEYNVPLDIVRQYIKGSGSFEVTLLDE
jgi:hypothetical protein